jgi:hypothetical protein
MKVLLTSHRVICWVGQHIDDDGDGTVCAFVMRCCALEEQDQQQRLSRLARWLGSHEWWEAGTHDPIIKSRTGICTTQICGGALPSPDSDGKHHERDQGVEARQREAATSRPSPPPYCRDHTNTKHSAGL